MTVFKANQCYCTDGIYWDETIKINITPELVDMVKEAKRLMDDNPLVRAIDYDAPDGYMSSAQAEALAKECAYDVEKITIMRSAGVYIYIQGKYDCSANAEYDLTRAFDKIYSGGM